MKNRASMQLEHEFIKSCKNKMNKLITKPKQKKISIKIEAFFK